LASASLSRTFSRKGEIGDEWTERVYFHPEANQSSQAPIEASKDELLVKIGSLIDLEDDIQNIWIYSHKLGL
jgi:hypothetical protein